VDANGRLSQLEERVRKLEGWRHDSARELREAERTLRLTGRQLRECRKLVDDMNNADAIQAGIRQELAARGHRRYSVAELAFAASVAAGSIVGTLLAVLHTLGVT